MTYDAFGNFLGELLPGAFRHPSALAADEREVAVLDSSGVVIIGPGRRAQAALPVASLGLEEAHGLALARDSLFVLGRQGLAVAPAGR